MHNVKINTGIYIYGRINGRKSVKQEILILHFKTIVNLAMNTSALHTLQNNKMSDTVINKDINFKLTIRHTIIE